MLLSWDGDPGERDGGTEGLWLTPASNFRLVDTTNPPVPMLSCRTRCNRTRVEATNSPTFPQGSAFKPS